MDINPIVSQKPPARTVSKKISSFGASPYFLGRVPLWKGLLQIPRKDKCPGGKVWSLQTSRVIPQAGKREDSHRKKESIPFGDLFGLDQWCPYQYKWSPQRQKFTKPPVGKNPCGGLTFSDPATFWTFKEVLAYLKKTGNPKIKLPDGRTAWRHGFILPEEPCGIVGLDIDDCIENGVILPEAAELIRVVDSYTECSPSGKGVRLFVLADGKGCPHVLDFRGISRVEVCATSKFVTVTGWHIPGTPSTINRRQDIIDQLFAHHQAKTPPKKSSGAGKTTASHGPGGSGSPAVIPGPVTTPTAKRILAVALKNQKFQAIYGCIDRTALPVLGFKSASEAFMYLLNSLASRCRKDKSLIREIILAAPFLALVPRFLKGNILDRQIDRACDFVKFMLPFLPTGRRKRTLEEWILDLLAKEKTMTFPEIYQQVKRYHKAEKVRSELRRLVQEGKLKKSLIGEKYQLLQMTGVPDKNG